MNPMSRILIITIVFLSMNSAQSQNLNKLRWQNRIILILSNDTECELCKTQIEELIKVPDELIERKLKVYTATPGQIKVIFDNKEIKKYAWRKSDAHDRYSTKGLTFEIVLIGLDGGVKLRQDQLLTNKELLEKIDSMPMRSSEMKGRNH